MGTREFTTEDERKTRRERVERIGLLAFGGSWQTPLAAALGLPRARVAQWMLVPDETKVKNLPAKPIPMWVMDALPAIAREAAARLRVNADELDALAAEDGAPPAPQGEPDAEGEAPQESGPAAAEAAVANDDDEFDLDAFVQAYGHVRLSQPDPEPEPAPAPPEGWRSRYGGAQRELARRHHEVGRGVRCAQRPRQWRS